MLRLLAFGLAIGASIQAWRQWPPDAPVAVTPAIAISLVGMVLAYVGGSRRRGASATAVAVASAEAVSTAQSTVQVAIINGAQPTAQTATAGVLFPSDEAPWLQGGRRASLDDLDGIAIEDLVEDAGIESLREG